MLKNNAWFTETSLSSLEKRCLFPSNEQQLANCSNSGVLGPVVGTIGTLQALEAIKYIMDTDFYGCTAMNSPVQIGKNAVIYAVQYMNGKRDFPPTSFTAPLLITKENAAQYYNPNALF